MACRNTKHSLVCGLTTTGDSFSPISCNVHRSPCEDALHTRERSQCQSEAPCSCGHHGKHTLAASVSIAQDAMDVDIGSDIAWAASLPLAFQDGPCQLLYTLCSDTIRRQWLALAFDKLPWASRHVQSQEQALQSTSHAHKYNASQSQYPNSDRAKHHQECRTSADCDDQPTCHVQRG